jgi:hypothetical protein
MLINRIILFHPYIFALSISYIDRRTQIELFILFFKPLNFTRYEQY